MSHTLCLLLLVWDHGQVQQWGFLAFLITNDPEQWHSGESKADARRFKNSCSGAARAAGRSVCSDQGFHTAQLWREDTWRYSVVEVLLKLQQLTHEVEVGGDNGSPGFDELVGVCHGHPCVLHQVGDHDGSRTRHPRLAVNQKANASLMCFLCREKQQIRTQYNQVCSSVQQPGGHFNFLNLDVECPT